MIAAAYVAALVMAALVVLAVCADARARSTPARHARERGPLTFGVVVPDDDADKADASVWGPW